MGQLSLNLKVWQDKLFFKYWIDKIPNCNNIYCKYIHLQTLSREPRNIGYKNLKNVLFFLIFRLLNNISVSFFIFSKK